MRIIGGEFKNRLLQAPSGQHTRPTASRLRETVFNICQAHIGEAHFLDLFAGSGAMGIEALSRGATAATFIEKEKEAVRCLKKNIAQFHLESKTTILTGDVLQILRQIADRAHFDVIYADPPYSDSLDEDPYIGELLKIIDSSSLLAPDGYVFFETAYPLTENDLKHLTYKKSRRVGKTYLHEWLWRSNS